MDPGLKEALRKAGGVRPLARAVGISHVAVWRWTRVPVARLLEVERITGIERERLRPDIPWRDPANPNESKDKTMVLAVRGLKRTTKSRAIAPDSAQSMPPS